MHVFGSEAEQEPITFDELASNHMAPKSFEL